MKPKILFGFLFLVSCAQKTDKGNHETSACKQEAYIPADSSESSFLPMFQKQFQFNRIAEGHIRIYYVPSFSQEMVLELSKGKGSIRIPDTGTIWESMQLRFYDEKGRLVSGGVADTTDSIPTLKLIEFTLSDQAANRLYSEIDSMGIWMMQSIAWEDCIAVDGVGVYVQTMKGGLENEFRFSVSEYKDQRYNRLSQIIEEIYRDKVNDKKGK